MLSAWQSRALSLVPPRRANGRSSGVVSTAALQDGNNFARKPPLFEQSLSSRDHEDSVPKNARSFGGSLVTLLFGATLLSERLNGMGIVQQLELHQGWHPVVLGSITLLVAAGVWPQRRTPSSAEAGEGARWARVQSVVTRAACLGLAATLGGELVTGKGALALLDIETGVEEVSDVEAIASFISLFLLTGPRGARTTGNNAERTQKKNQSVDNDDDDAFLY